MSTATTRKNRIPAHPEPAVQESLVKGLVGRIEQDIRQRGLTAGAPYMTALELGEHFGVSTATANRAMALLADRQLLVRRRQRGTFVGPKGAVEKQVQIRMFYVLLGAVGVGVRDFPYAPLISGIQHAIEGAQIQVSFVPPEGGAAFVEELIRPSLESGQLAGVIAVGAPQSWCESLRLRGVPVVLCGSPYVSHPDLPSVDIDNFLAGRLMAEHLIEQGHRRIGLVMRGAGRPGDHRFLDGAIAAIDAAGLPAGALLIRTVPFELSAFPSVIREMLTSEKRPTGVMVHAVHLARVVIAEAAALQLSVPGDLDLVFGDHPGHESLPFAAVRPQGGFERFVREVAALLAARCEGKTQAAEHVIVPVELVAALP